MCPQRPQQRLPGLLCPAPQRTTYRGQRAPTPTSTPEPCCSFTAQHPRALNLPQPPGDCTVDISRAGSHIPSFSLPLPQQPAGWRSGAARRFHRRSLSLQPPHRHGLGARNAAAFSAGITCLPLVQFALLQSQSEARKVVGFGGGSLCALLLPEIRSRRLPSLTTGFRPG